MLRDPSMRPSEGCVAAGEEQWKGTDEHLPGIFQPVGCPRQGLIGARSLLLPSRSGSGNSLGKGPGGRGGTMAPVLPHYHKQQE